jgi:hypothetical protein
MIDWTGCGRKRLWHISKYYSEIRAAKQRNVTPENPVRIVLSCPRLEPVTPRIQFRNAAAWGDLLGLSTSYTIRRCITVFIRTCYWSLFWAAQIQSIFSYPHCLVYILMLPSEGLSSVQLYWLKFCLLLRFLLFLGSIRFLHHFGTNSPLVQMS